MDFWLGRIDGKTGVPYTLFFGLIGVFLYILSHFLHHTNRQPQLNLVRAEVGSGGHIRDSQRYRVIHNMVEGCNCIQKDWLGLASLRARDLHKARLHAALAMLSEAVSAYTRVQNGVAKGLTSLASIT